MWRREAGSLAEARRAEGAAAGWVDAVVGRRHAVMGQALARAVLSAWQGLALVHFSAQRKRFLRDRGWNQGLFRACFGGVRGA